MKKVNALVLGLAVLLALGCEKEEPSAPVNAGTDPETYTRCQLTSDRVDTLTSRYTYNAQGKVVEKAYAYGKEKYEYNALGKISRLIRFHSQADTSEVDVFEYNSDSLLVKVTQRSGATPAGVIYKWAITTIAYDAQNRVASQFSHDVNQPGTIFRKVEYTYAGANKVESKAWELNRVDNTWQLHNEAVLVCDNQKTPHGKNSPYNSLTGHNELSYAVTFYLPYNYSHSRTTTYTYNAAGYPTSSTSVTDGQYTSISTFNYNCQ